MKLGYQKQDGSALIVSLLMLLILTILALATVNTSSVDMKIASNAQLQKEAEAVAQMQIESFLSDRTNFTSWGPASTTLVKSSTQTVKGQVYAVNIYRPVCIGYSCVGGTDPLNQSQNWDDTECTRVASWDIPVLVVDNNNKGAKVLFHQGVRMKLNVNEIATGAVYDEAEMKTKYCPS